MTDMIESPVESFELPAWARPSQSGRSRGVVRKRPRHFIELDIEYDPRTETFSDFRSKVFQAVPKYQDLLRSDGIEVDAQWKLASELFDVLDDVSVLLWEDFVREGQLESCKAEFVDCIEIGSVRYALKQPIRVTTKTVANHEFKFSSELLTEVFVGRGVTIERAREDFMVQVHREFQSLVKLRPHKRNEEQSRRWSSLVEFIDVDRYWEDTPVALMEVGRVASINSDGASVAWLDGDRHETISWRLAPPEFAALRDGDWFEALVERQATTGKLQAVRYVKPIEPLSVMSQDELRQWFASLPRVGEPSRSESLAHSG